MDQMKAGREDAFEVFAGSYIPGLYRFARRRLHDDSELTKDVVQSTVCRVIENLDGWRAEAPFFAWLCACCANEIAAHYRRRGRRPREVELVDDAADGDPTARLEAAEVVHLALDRIPPAYARAVEWRYVEGLEVAEIARRLGASYKAAESLLSRARAAFREAYAQLSAMSVAGSSAASCPEEGIVP